MTLTHRRLLLLSITVVFLVVSTWALFMASGWQLYEHRVVRSAGLYIDTHPSATVSLGGIVVGTTPFRTSAEKPGLVQVTLSRPGYHTWSKTIALESGQATSISNVRLFPQVTPVAIDQLAGEQIIIDRTGATVWRIRTDESAPTISADTAPRFAAPRDLPWVPDQAQLSPDGSNALFSNADRMVAFPGQGEYWDIPRVDWPTWSPDGSAVLYGILHGHLVRIDVLEHTIQTYGPTTSVVAAGGSLWTSTTTGASTILQRREPIATAVPIDVFTIQGPAQFYPQSAYGLLYTNQGQATRIIGTAAIGWRQQPLGAFTALLGGTGPLVWTDGVTVDYLIGQKTYLVDRYSTSIVWAGWFHVADSLVLSDGHDVFVLEPNGNGGMTEVARQSLPDGAEFIVSKPDHTGFWYRYQGRTYRWSWRSS